MESAIRLYSNKKVQKEILNSAKDREVGVKYGEKGYGKRPDILQFESDVYELAKQGATSFHISVERWKDPLKLSAGMTKKQLDELRIGYDLLIDIDSDFLEYSRTCAGLIIEALKYNGIENIALKFSGRSGFHIGIPFEAFPEKINNQEARLLFPDGVKIVGSYLKELIKEPLKEEILKISDIKDITKVSKKDVFDPYNLIVIDSLLMTSRHLFRSPYSLNEKSGLVSLPLNYKKLKFFKIKDAKIENLDFSNSFIIASKENEAARLMIQAFDWYRKETRPIKEEKKEVKYDDVHIKIKEDYFPECIKKLIKGVEKDGRKRALFILMNFLGKMNWNVNEIEDFLLKWNKNNYEELKEGYIKAQINWYKKNKTKLLPPNCDNESYYSDLGVKCKLEVCKAVKNPVNYSYRRIKFSSKKNKQI